jgi:hypothetical protein
MSSCVPNTALRLGPSINRRFVKAGAKKFIRVIYTLRVKGTSKSLRLTDMGVQVTLPAGATVKGVLPSSGSKKAGGAWGSASKAGARGSTSNNKAGGAHVNVTANVVTWYPLAFEGTATRALKVKATLAVPRNNAGANVLFGATFFQNGDGLAAAPYCHLPARDVGLAVKYA